MEIKRRIKEHELPKVVEGTGLRGKDRDRVLSYLRNLREGKINTEELRQKAKRHGIDEGQLAHMKENMIKLGIIEGRVTVDPTILEKVEIAVAFLKGKIGEQDVHFLRNDVVSKISKGALNMNDLGLCAANAKTLQENLFSAGLGARIIPLAVDNVTACRCNCVTGPCPAEAISPPEEHGGSIAMFM